MKTVRKQLSRVNPVLLLLLPCAPAFAAGGVARPALGGVALLWALFAACAFQLARSSRRDQRRIPARQLDKIAKRCPCFARSR